MRIFLSLLTVYTYTDDEIRMQLNMEEIEKFYDGLHFAGDIHRGMIFSDYARDEIQRIIEELPSPERKPFQLLLSRIEDFRFYRIPLTDYGKAYSKIYEVVYDMLVHLLRKDDVSLYINLSCGHKLGALALYLAAMHAIHEGEIYRYLDGRGAHTLRVRPYHAEKGVVEDFPVMNFEYREKRDWERYLILLKKPMRLEDFKNVVRGDAPEQRSYADSALMYLMSHRYIESHNDTLSLTVRGRTLVEVMERIG